MPNGAQAVVLCEGLQDFVFLRRTLLELGYESRRIRPLMQPHNGKGSGEQYVRERYADEVRSHRSRVARMKTVLIVHTDADSGTVQERYDSLDERLEAAGLSRRGAREAIAVLIPKRNTETWIHFFDGLSVDEETAYPKLTGRESDAQRAAETFAVYGKNGTTPEHASPSLIRGLQEMRRVL
ncbi:MAG TPA: hypothetical protein PKA58_35140 [Polyangium sp.]|jgi:hypothetical protein|nr:hypothetical protein [Polyangium sp.]